MIGFGLLAARGRANVLLGEERKQAAECVRQNHYTHSVPSGKSHWVNPGKRGS